ncbi:ribonuclease HI family protein [Terriglobus sp. ADX1]|uniref:ribonuclease HI family protein n=1 Tax=Terriglobus sp. ADX1 TaxID=2794063 RepID=UPI002FE541A0
MSTGDLFASPQPSFPRNTAAVTLLAHCDGGARGNPGPAGYGAVIAKEDGAVLAELSEFLGFKTNNFAEYSGLLGVLQWTLDNGYTRLKVVSDSELMVKQIQGKYKVNSPDLRQLFEEAKRRIARLELFNISHALRHKNKTADRLANEAMDRGMGKTPTPTKATPYPQKSSEPAAPRRMDPATQRSEASATPQGEMLRGFVRDGGIHLLGGKSLPDGVFVKIIRE